MHDDPHVLLMLRFQNGDEHAFHELFDIYKGQLLNFIYRFCFDRRIAEELTQEVFLRVYRSAGRYRPDARLSTWIYRIATNICLNEMRSGKYMYERSLPGSEDGNQGADIEAIAHDAAFRPDDQAVARERDAIVQQAIQRLPEKQRVALIWSVYEQASYQEIGRRLRCSEGAVKSIIHRAKQAMRDMLQKREAAER